MTVQDLINRLNSIEDKSKKVCIFHPEWGDYEEVIKVTETSTCYFNYEIDKSERHYIVQIETNNM